MPAIRTSESTTSKARRSTSSRPASASAAGSTSWPSSRRYAIRCARIPKSSSTTSMAAMFDVSAARQLEDKPAPTVRLALHADVTTVRLHDVAYDREPEPRGADGHSGPLDVRLEDAL